MRKFSDSEYLVSKEELDIILGMAEKIDEVLKSLGLDENSAFLDIKCGEGFSEKYIYLKSMLNASLEEQKDAEYETKIKKLLGYTYTKFSGETMNDFLAIYLHNNKMLRKSYRAVQGKYGDKSPSFSTYTKFIQRCKAAGIVNEN